MGWWAGEEGTVGWAGDDRDDRDDRLDTLTNRSGREWRTVCLVEEDDVDDIDGIDTLLVWYNLDVGIWMERSNSFGNGVGCLLNFFWVLSVCRMERIFGTGNMV